MLHIFLEPREANTPGDRIAGTVSAIERLDLIVFVPIEDPDRIDVPASLEGTRAPGPALRFLRGEVLESLRAKR